MIHVIAPYLGESPLAQRQALFLESIDRAVRENVTLLALSDGHWQRAGWSTRLLPRDTRSLGEAAQKPFIKDLFNSALEFASPSDWILYTNTDCAIDPGLYRHLLTLRATAVEYMRMDVEGDPANLDELFSNKRENYVIGLDGLALRASFWEEIREHLPDFIIGEPHWDTTYSGILRRIIPVRRSKDMLFHPKHEQIWDIENPTAGGSHNHALFIDAVAYGHSSSSLIEDCKETTDTAVICSSFGNDPERIRANMEGITRQLEQDLYCDFYLVEAVPEDGKSAYPEDFLFRVNHLPVPASSRTEGLFQKESLMNLGWKHALTLHPYRYFIFNDADIYCQDTAWFRRMRERLQLNPSRAVQGFRMVQDTLDPKLKYSSIASAYVLNHQTDLTLNPGMSWALHRRVLEMGAGFNAGCIECAGDSAFVAEYLNWDYYQYDPFLYQFSWFREIERTLPFRVEIDCAPYDIVHVHHGFVKDRNYDGIRYAIDGMPPIHEFVERDAQGLLSWVDPDCPEREILRRKNRMASRAEVDSLFDELGYARVCRNSASEPHIAAARPVFENPAVADSLVFRLPASPGAHGQADHGVLNLFNPVEVFRRDFPFSWCFGVTQIEDHTFIPISADEKPYRLVLDGLEDAEYIMGVIPIQPSWEPFDLADYSTLHLTVEVSESMISDARVALVSKNQDETECDSREVSLVELGLQAGKPFRFSIPLESFSGEPGFRSDRTRLLKFVGHNSFRMELARLYFD